MLVFNKKFSPRYGEVIKISPLIHRLVAPNPSPFTFHGTGTYIIGQGGASDGCGGAQVAQGAVAPPSDKKEEGASDGCVGAQVAQGAVVPPAEKEGGASDGCGGNSSRSGSDGRAPHQIKEEGASDGCGGNSDTRSRKAEARPSGRPSLCEESPAPTIEANLKKTSNHRHKPSVALIDPGPAIPSHIQALEKFLETVTVSHILITHNHVDHSPAAQPLKLITGADIYGFDVAGQADIDNHAEEGRDRNFTPDHILKDGDIIEGDGWTIEVVHTPGHLSNHLCFGLREEKALFTGDHVMGWSTSVVSQPDGDMKDYLLSLEKLLPRDDVIYYPTHGAPIENPKPYVKALIAHRHSRESQILDVLSAGAMTIPQMVEIIYSDIPTYLHPAAASSLLSHLIHIVAMGRVTCRGKVGMESIFTLT